MDFLRRVTRAEHEPCYLRTCRVTSLTNNSSDTKAAPCRCVRRPHISLSFFSSLFLFLSGSPESKRRLFTLRRCALRANGRGSSHEKWTRGCLMAPQPAPLSFHSRRRWRRCRLSRAPPSGLQCDRAECPRREKRWLFPSSKGRSLFSFLFLLFFVAFFS